MSIVFSIVLALTLYRSLLLRILSLCRYNSPSFHVLNVVA